MRVQNDALQPCVPRSVAAEVQRRFDQGNAFGTSVVLEFESRSLGATAAHSENLVSEDDQTATVVIGAELPHDLDGRRIGRPDLLVAAGDGGFRAVGIKHHIVLDAQTPDENAEPALIADLGDPGLESAAFDARFSARKRLDDLLELAHYQRMLEAAGLAAERGRWAGILGTERRIVWFDLEEPIWSATTSSQQPAQSTMERYDEAFTTRLEIVAAAIAHKTDASVELRAVPVRIGECDACPWWEYCKSRLQQGSGDISLIPRLGRREWLIHRRHGVQTRAELAQLDPVAARLVCSGIDVIELQRLVEGLPDDTPIRDLGAVIRAKTQLARLEGEGLATFGDVMRLDRRTASYHGAGISWLPEQIDLARAALGDAPIYRRRGVSELSVPRGHVEVDVDMENIEGGAYLWGALLSVREAGVTTSTYHSFVTWEPLTPATETSNFAEFWHWLQTTRDDAAQLGMTFCAYCYNVSAENTYLRKSGLALGVLDEVADFIRSDAWVDLLRVVDDQLITGTGSGLKAIAPLTGFRWAVDDPGGGLSMVRHDIAAGGDDTVERQDARDWLLTYNRGDVEATLSIREWLESSAASVPPISTLDGTVFATADGGGRGMA